MRPQATHEADQSGHLDLSSVAPSSQIFESAVRPTGVDRRLLAIRQEQKEKICFDQSTSLLS